MGTHNIYFRGEIRKLSAYFVEKKKQTKKKQQQQYFILCSIPQRSCLMKKTLLRSLSKRRRISPQTNVPQLRYSSNNLPFEIILFLFPSDAVNFISVKEKYARNISQQTHNVDRTSIQRWFNVESTLFQRCVSAGCITGVRRIEYRIKNWMSVLSTYDFKICKILSWC